MATQVAIPGSSLSGAPPATSGGLGRRVTGRLGLIPLPPLPIHAPSKSLPTCVPAAAQHDRLVLALLPLVKRVAYQMRDRLPLHVEVDDLVSTGVIGLVDAIRKFDGRKHVRLEQYARHRIRGAILDGLRSLDTASRDMRKKNRNAENTYRQLEVQLGRPPSDAELAEGLGVSLEAWYRMERELRTIGMDWLRPLGSVGSKEHGSSHVEALAASNQNHQFESCYRREQKEIFDHVLAHIPERERQIVQLYYHQELTMKEIGSKLGIDESRVSQLHSLALARLRRRVRDLLRHRQPSEPQFAWQSGVQL